MEVSVNNFQIIWLSRYYVDNAKYQKYKICNISSRYLVYFTGTGQWVDDNQNNFWVSRYNNIGNVKLESQY